MSNNGAQTIRTAENFSQSYACYRVQITLKNVLIKGLNCPLNLNNSSVNVFALAREGNNSNNTLLRYVQVLYLCFFFLRKTFN